MVRSDSRSPSGAEKLFIWFICSLDFCWRRRDELVDAVYAHFGPSHVARIATYNTCGPRAAYQEAAKVLGLPPGEAARRSKLLPWHAQGDLDLASVVAKTPGFWRRGNLATATADGDALPPEREALLLAAAQHLLRAPRHLGVHPGGVVITPEPIGTHAPLEGAAKGVVVTQYDMHFVEGLGLVKIDLLGNRALSIVHDCTTMLRRHGVAVPDLQAIAEDDARTAALLQQGRTLGCFQVESPAMRTVRQAWCDCGAALPSAMANIVVFQHSDIGPGRFGVTFRDHGFRLDIRRPDQGDRVPGDLDGVAGLLILGGSQNVTDAAQYEWMRQNWH